MGPVLRASPRAGAAMSALGFLVLVTFAYYLAARAEITRPLWSRYGGALDRLARCPACSGFWLGMALATYVRPPFAGHGTLGEILFWGGVWGLVCCPVGTTVLITAL